MADVNPGSQYANWQQYGGSDSAFGEAGTNFKKWLAAGLAQKSGLVDALDSIGSPVPKSLQPVAPPMQQSVTPNAMPAIPAAPVAPSVVNTSPMSIPAVGEIKGLSDKLKEAPDFLKMIWGG